MTKIMNKHTMHTESVDILSVTHTYTHTRWVNAHQTMVLKTKVSVHPE